MSFTLKQTVPWGRTFEEYVSMFGLSASDLKGRILGCGDGPASFNASLTMRGGTIISIDPLYQFSKETIQHRIDETYDVVMEQTKANRQEFVWENIKSPEALGEIRMKAMAEFLSDYPQGTEEGRYVAGSLPHLPFSSRQFDLAVCSHFLFLYSEQFSEKFHLASIAELCRVAQEVRIFPLLELGTKPSRHLKSVISKLENQNCSASIENVAYEFQKNGNRMLKIRQH
ncbi:class I SAM-dependent methyltransferase [Pontiellaceae bacterium B12219]|nr:class I SAM-dependent methyltransferase [Pontiellaceae bacterium B12219]